MSGGRSDEKRGAEGMSRRELIQVGAASGLALAAATAGASAAKGAGTGAAVPPFELEEATIAGLRETMDKGELTAGSLCRMYFERIEAVDRQGPALRSVIELNPDALHTAEQLDKELKEKGPRGPLHGMPLLIKDNIDTADAMATTAGSLALVGAKPARDAFVVERLRAAGAVILGKTNLSEWANFRSTRSSSGWSGRGGQCANPYALDRNPCGSSSGTGTSVSANLAVAGVGTETDGSVVCPSHATSLVGIKPTVGLVSRAGIVPISHNQDTAGPMARTVADAAALLSAMAGVDPRDPATAASAGKAAADYTRFLDPAGLKGARIGVARKHFFGYSPDADAIVEGAIDAMKRLGATIVDPADVPHAGELDDDEFTVLLYDFKADLNAYLAAVGGDPAGGRTLKDLIAFNEKEKAREMPYFGQEIFLMAEKKGPLSDEAYTKALEKCQQLSRAEGIDAVMDEHKLDALVAPTGAPPWMTDLVDGDHFLGASSTPAAVSGYASLTVPAGYAFGLPVGVTFIGRAWSEGTLIKLAYALEQATRVRKPPRLLATADLTVA
jgi:amidase